MTYDAAAGKVNDLRFDQTGTPNQVIVTAQSAFPAADNDPMTPGAGCTQTQAASSGVNQQVTCDGVNSVVDNLGDLDDESDGGGLSTLPIATNGGPGDDGCAGFFGCGGLQGGGANDTINGDDGDDTSLFGGFGNDAINGGNGNDSGLDGSFGDDTIDGGLGDDLVTDSGFPLSFLTPPVTDNDTINGSEGDDTLFANGGNDTLNGGNGDDRIDGGADNDTVDGGSGDDSITDAGAHDPAATPPVTSNDTLNGGDGQDDVNGGPGDDTIDGGNGSDGPLSGGRGIDTVSGSGGDDFLAADQDQTADTYNGGPGNDTISYGGYSAPVSVNLGGGAGQGQGGENDTLSNDIENAFGGNDNDILVGSGVANLISGNGGNDLINGAAGDDGVFGNGGDDVVAGGDGRDFAGGGDGNDTLNGENGDDSLQGNAGDDVFNGGAGNDTADYTDRFTNVVVSLDGAQNDGESGEVDNADADKSVENVFGGAGNDTITGNAAANFIDSDGGNDVIDVKDGTFATDIVACGAGFDSVTTDALDTVDTSGPDRCEVVPAATISRVAPTVSLKVSPKRDRKAPYRFKSTGKIGTGAVPANIACASSSFVIVQVKSGSKTISARKAKVAPDCTYKSRVTFLKKRLKKAKSLKVRAKYSGNKYLSGKSSKFAKVRVK